MKEPSKPVDMLSLGAALVAFAILVGFREWFHLTSPTIVALSYLLVVLVTATTANLWVAVVASVVADLCLNYFFMPPFGTFFIADPQNWVALFAFLAVSLIASNLSSTARRRARDATARRDELARLFDLTRDILLTTDGNEAIRQLPSLVAGHFDFNFAAICLPRSGEWEVYEAGAVPVVLDRHELAVAFAGIEQTDENPQRGPYAGHRILTRDGVTIRLVPLRVGARAVGLLAATGGPVEPGTFGAIAGIVAIAIERAQFLDERKRAELARQSAELKSALLASLSHDLRTPLTAIRVAGSNLGFSWLADEDRREQSEVVLTEVERLNRLFQNILEMTRIDAGAVAAEARWVHPSEIIEAARDHVHHALKQHPVDVHGIDEALVRVDPRLTASALAHVLENAAQYSPPGARIDVGVSVSSGGLMIDVTDRGPGIQAADLPRLFERFYRGVDARHRVSGTGMGLSIARGLLAAEQGRISAENRPDGGARFTIVVPAESKPAIGAQKS